MAHELKILTQLSALDADNFINHTDPVAAVPIIGHFRAMAFGILRNPPLPAHDPSIAARLWTERDEARAQNKVLQGQVCMLENKRTPMMAEGDRLTEPVATLNETIQGLQSDNNAYQKRANTLQNDLRHKRENLVALRNNVADTQPAPPPASFTVPNPERYNGNCEKLPISKKYTFYQVHQVHLRLLLLLRQTVKHETHWCLLRLLVHSFITPVTVNVTSNTRSLILPLVATVAPKLTHLTTWFSAFS